MTHNVNYKLGTDANNHIAHCSCGWKYSGTYLEVRRVGAVHCEEANHLAWHDPKRAFQAEPKRKYAQP